MVWSAVFGQISRNNTFLLPVQNYPYLFAGFQGSEFCNKKSIHKLSPSMDSSQVSDANSTYCWFMALD